MFSLEEVEARVGPQDEPPPHPPGGGSAADVRLAPSAAASAHLPEVSAGDDPEGVVEAVEGAAHGRVGLGAGGHRLAVLVLHPGQAEFEHVSSCMHQRREGILNWERCKACDKLQERTAGALPREFWIWTCGEKEYVHLADRGRYSRLLSLYYFSHVSVIYRAITFNVAPLGKFKTHSPPPAPAAVHGA